MLFTEQQMNSLGYAYLDRKQVKEAVTLFQMNVEAYPGSSNVYDSLGEALMADHQYSPAVRSYTRSIELNPGNEHGRKKLQELKALMAGQAGHSL
jgi:cytochrome c-type biogenesis protein CcmH/NrfG